MHLFIEMPPDALDVNVHPTKAEVRFREQSLVHEVVRRALMDALGQGGVPQLQLRPEHASVGPVAAAIPGVLGGGMFPNRWVPGASSAWNADRAIPTADGNWAPSTSAPGTLSTQHLRCTQAPSGTAATDSAIRPMIPLGQFRDTFIIAVDDEGIAIIDQHVAHERVLFERVMERLTTGRLESQRLLVPMLMDVSRRRSQTLLNRAAELESSRLRDRALRRRDDQSDRGAGAAEDRRQREGAARARGGSRRARPRRAGAGRAPTDRGDDRVPRGGQGELPADATRR